MDGIQQYLLSIIASAIICALVINLIGKEGILSSITKLLCGLFLIYTILNPWVNVQLYDFSSYFSDLKLDATTAVEEGKESAIQASITLIKEQMRAYILDKAATLDMDITVEIIMDDESFNTPIGVKIGGIISPYAKQRLSQIIVTELGIPEENQVWI